MELNGGRVSSGKALAEVVVIDLHIVDDLGLSVIVSELDLTSEVCIVDEDQVGMGASLSKVSRVVSEESHNFRLKVEGWEGVEGADATLGDVERTRSEVEVLIEHGEICLSNCRVSRDSNIMLK